MSILDKIKEAWNAVFVDDPLLERADEKIKQYDKRYEEQEARVAVLEGRFVVRFETAAERETRHAEEREDVARSDRARGRELRNTADEDEEDRVKGKELRQAEDGNRDARDRKHDKHS